MKDSINKLIYKCFNKCRACTNESISNNLCTSCNNNNGYYQKYIDDLYNIEFFDCYNETPEAHYLDNISKIYMPCYYKCKNCEQNGTDNNNMCTECYSNFTLNGSNCY